MKSSPAHRFWFFLSKYAPNLPQLITQVFPALPVTVDHKPPRADFNLTGVNYLVRTVSFFLVECSICWSTSYKKQTRHKAGIKQQSRGRHSPLVTRLSLRGRGILFPHGALTEILPIWQHNSQHSPHTPSGRSTPLCL